MSRPKRRGCLIIEEDERRLLLSAAVPMTVSATTSVTAQAASSSSAAKAISARLITNGKKVSGAIIDFAGPMDPVSVANPRRYILVDDHKMGVRDWLAHLSFRSISQGNLYFASAHYNPGENSVTLTLAKPVNNLGRYKVGSAWNDAKKDAQAPVDAQGHKLARFAFELNGNGALSRSKV